MIWPGGSFGENQATSEGSLEEIVVTAQRRSENLQNVPVAVTAISAAQLAATGISTSQDLSLVTPGLVTPQAAGYIRSEEHTSELQSHLNLVCRLLLEKKKTSYTKRQIELIVF